MGDWPTVQRIPFQERLAFFYLMAQSDGLTVNWSTGELYRK